MVSNRIKDKIRLAYMQDKTVCTKRGELSTTFGKNPLELLELYDITKADLIRLERRGFAMKARYATENKTVRGRNGVTGPHRIRWVIFDDLLDVPREL